MQNQLYKYRLVADIDALNLPLFSFSTPNPLYFLPLQVPWYVVVPSVFLLLVLHTSLIDYGTRSSF